MTTSKAKQPTFEENLTALTTIVNELEQGDVPLETALAKFQTGIKLSRSLEKTLTDAENTLTQIVNEQGEVGLLDPQQTTDQEQK